MFDHDRWVHGGKVHLRHLFMKAHQGLEDEASPVSEEKRCGGFELLRLPFLRWNQVVVLVSPGKLHGGERGSDRRAG